MIDRLMTDRLIDRQTEFKLCVCSICMCVLAHVNMCGGQRLTSDIFLCHSASCLLRQGLSKLQLDWPVSPQDPFSSSTGVPNAPWCPACPRLLRIQTQALPERTLSTEPSLWHHPLLTLLVGLVNGILFLSVWLVCLSRPCFTHPDQS